MNDSAQKEAPWWRMNPLIWLGLVLPVAISFGLSMGWLSIGLLIQLLDARSWPLWLIYPLWGAVCWRVLDLPCWSQTDHRLAKRLKPIIVLLVPLLIVWHNGWYTLTFRRRLYAYFYSPFIIGPISQFMVDGKWNWRIFILPTACILALVFLISLMIRLRKRKTGAEHDVVIREQDK